MERPSDEALAALAGQQLAVPGRNSIILSALPRHYGITSGLEFFGLSTEAEAMHFRPLWEAIAADSGTDTGKLIEAARLEIWEHITFWDDVYSAVLMAGQRSAPAVIMAGHS